MIDYRFRTIVVLLIACLNFKFLAGQTFSWAKQFGVGASETNGSTKFFDANGNIISSISFTGVMDIDPGPNVYNLNSANGSIVILKLSPNGSFISAIQHNLPNGYFFVNEAGEFMITGKFSGTIDLDPGPGSYPVTSVGYDDIYISKLSALGNFIWGHRIGGPGVDNPGGIISNNQGNIFIHGKFGYIGTFDLSTEVDFDPDPVDEYILNSDGTNNNGFILSLDANGNFNWAQKQTLIALKDVDSFGNLYIWGAIDETPAENTTYISKIDNDGKKIWSKYISNTSLQVGALSTSNAGEILVSGGFSGSIFIGPYNISATTLQDPFYAKLNANGDVVFARSIKTNGFVFDIQFDNYDNIYFTGRFTSNGNIDFDPGPGVVTLNCKGNWAAFIQKLSNSGNIIWVKQIGGEAKSQTYGTSIAIVDNGDVYTSLKFKGTIDFDPGAGKSILKSIGTWDFVLHKLAQTNSGAKEMPVTKQTKSNSLNIFPNPNNGNFYIEVPVVGEKGRLELFDNKGVVIYSKTFDGTITQKIPVHIRVAARGYYILKVTGSLYNYTGSIQLY